MAGDMGGGKWGKWWMMKAVVRSTYVCTSITFWILKSIPDQSFIVYLVFLTLDIGLAISASSPWNIPHRQGRYRLSWLIWLSTAQHWRIGSANCSNCYFVALHEKTRHAKEKSVCSVCPADHLTDSFLMICPECLNRNHALMPGSVSRGSVCMYVHRTGLNQKRVNASSGMHNFDLPAQSSAKSNP